MKHLAAFALLVLGGNESPSAADVEAFLKKAGVSADSEKIEAMIKALEGKKFHEAVESGLAKMATMGGGGGASSSGGGSGGGDGDSGCCRRRQASFALLLVMTPGDR